MKEITEKVYEPNSVNAWGQTSPRYVQKFEIEEEDVGVSRPHFKGQHAESYTFKRGDVGKKITVYSESNWTCWTLDHVK